MRRKQVKKDYSLLLVLLYLLLSFFAAITFSIFALKAKRNNKTVFWWFLLALIFIGLFGLISYSLVLTSSLKKDAGWYYLGFSSLIANAIALFVLLITLFVKPTEYGANTRIV